MPTFGQFIREKRLNADFSLRKFCQLTQIDPSNWSKIERDLLVPGLTREKMEEIANLLHLAPGTIDYMDFFNLAEIAKGRIPEDIYTNQDVLNVLPIFFRTVQGQKPTPEDLDKVVALLKKR